MEVTPALGGQVNYTLATALAVYKSEDGALITQHEVVKAQGKAILGPGRLIQRDALHALLREAEGLAQERYFLSPNILSWESGALTWWVPAQRRPIYFSNGDAKIMNLDNAEVLHPPLLMKADRRGLSVWSLQENERPTKDTKLFFAPYYNVYGSGRMCTGSVGMPSVPTPVRMSAYERGFFQSNFTHGAAAEGGVCNHPGGHLGFWKLMKGAKTWDPARHGKFLKPVIVSITDVINDRHEARGTR